MCTNIISTMFTFGLSEPMIHSKRAELIAGLKSDLLRLNGFNQLDTNILKSGFELIIDAFPNSSFPIGAVHEFLSEDAEGTAATSGFSKSPLKTF